MIDRKPESVLGIVGSVFNLLMAVLVAILIIVLPIVIDNVKEISENSGVTYETHLDGNTTYDLDMDEEDALILAYDIIQVAGIFSIVYFIIIGIVGFVMSAKVKKKTHEKATTEGIVFIVLSILTSLNVFLLIAGILALSRNPKIEEPQNQPQ